MGLHFKTIFSGRGLGLALVMVMGCAMPQQTYATTPAPPKAPVATAKALELSRVTHDHAIEFWPRISPDGQTLLFTTRDLTKKSTKEASSVASIKLASPGRNLLAGPYASMASWYPDGKKFVFVNHKMDKNTLVRSPISGVGMTFITPSPMGDSDGQPAVSPDGTRIAFHTLMGTSYSICTVNADGSNFTVYVDGFSPQWHPNGRVIAFDRPVGKISQVFTIDLTTGQVTQLTSGDKDSHFPVWSPDGKWLAFVSNRDGKENLYMMKSDGSSVSQLTIDAAYRTSSLDWSTDGFIYFSSKAGAPTATSNYANIWRLKPSLPQ